MGKYGMKIIFLKIIFLGFFLSNVINLSAAAVRLAVDFDTYVTFYLSDRTEVRVFVKKNTGGLLNSFIYDAFFKNGPSVGINKLRWEGQDDLIYESILDIKPGDGFVNLHITKNNLLVDPDPFSPYRNKIVRRVLQ